MFGKDPVEVAWEQYLQDEHGCLLSKIVFEFENGRVRELQGRDAVEWFHDFVRSQNGRDVNWQRHKFTESQKEIKDGN